MSTRAAYHILFIGPGVLAQFDGDDSWPSGFEIGEDGDAELWISNSCKSSTSKGIRNGVLSLFVMTS